MRIFTQGPVRHPWMVILLVTLVTVFFALQLPKARMDNNNLRFIPADDTERLLSRWIDDTFGSSSFILVGLARRSGTVFDAAFLQRIRDFVGSIEALPIVGEVNSLMNADYISGETGEDGSDYVIVEKLVGGDFSGTPEEIAELRERLASWGVYRESLVSSDERAAQIYVPLEVEAEDAGNPESIAGFLKIRDMARRAFAGDTDVYVTGIPVITSTINEAMGADLARLIPIVLAVILVILFLPLKNLFYVALSLLSVVIATVWAMGAMPLFGVKMSVLSTVLPVILIAVGNSYALHVIIHYVKDPLSGAGDVSHAARIEGVMEKITPAITIASLTTCISFASFCVTSVEPIREFGAFSAFGVFASYVLALFLTPAILVIRGPRQQGAPVGGIAPVSKADGLARFLSRITARPKSVIAFSVLLVAFSAWGASKLVVDNIFIEYFRSGTDIVKSDNFIRTYFGGSKVLSVVAEADSAEELLHPDTLKALDDLNAHLESTRDAVGKVLSFTDFVKRTNQVFHAGDEAYYEIPFDPRDYDKTDKDELGRLIANYLVFVGDAVEHYADDPLEPLAIKSTVQLRTVGQIDTDAVVRAIRAFTGEHFPPGIRVRVGGGALVEKSTNDRVVQSVWSSMIIAFVSLFLILALHNRSLFAGLQGVLPLIALVLCNFALMGIFGIRLNIGTALISSLTMGIGIDYTVHMMEAYKREKSLSAVYRTGGIAIITDALSTGAGFAVLVFSQFVMLSDFGVLVAFSLLLSALAALILIPVLGGYT